MCPSCCQRAHISHIILRHDVDRRDHFTIASGTSRQQHLDKPSWSIQYIIFGYTIWWDKIILYGIISKNASFTKVNHWIIIIGPMMLLERDIKHWHMLLCGIGAHKPSPEPIQNHWFCIPRKLLCRSKHTALAMEFALCLDSVVDVPNVPLNQSALHCWTCDCWVKLEVVRSSYKSPKLQVKGYKL